MCRPSTQVTYMSLSEHTSARTPLCYCS
uniref:Uncharacterized protein n=1 Tax=Anguilla anguilla TaxID=7936 RepID=A0A0E9SMP6_ANGAN